MTVARLLAALAVVPVLAACSLTSASSLSADALQMKVVAGLARDNPDFMLGGVTCPRDLPFTAGATEVCTVNVDGVDAQFTVTVTSADSGRGDVDLTPVRPILDLGKAGQAVVAAIAKSGRTATADCRTMNGGHAVLLADVGASFRCSWAVSSTDSGTATVTVTGGNGDITAHIDA